MCFVLTLDEELVEVMNEQANNNCKFKNFNCYNHTCFFQFSSSLARHIDTIVLKLFVFFLYLNGYETNFP